MSDYWRTLWRGLLAGIKCPLIGHDLVRTGKHLIILEQLRCTRCDQMFCGRVDDGATVPWDWTWESYFDKRMGKP